MPTIAPSWNIAPSSPVIACYRCTKLATVPWGITTRSGERPLINARSETAHTKPTFAKAFDKARCLAPVNGFYEWTTNRSGRKRPVWITRLDDQPFALGSADGPAELRRPATMAGSSGSRSSLLHSFHQGRGGGGTGG